MQTKTYTIYEYDELNEKGKENARDWFTSGNDYPFLTEAMTDQAHELLTEVGFKDIDIKDVYYSLSCSQGDGAMAEFTGNYAIDGDYYHVNCKHAGRYSHYNSTEYDITDIDGNDASTVVYNYIKLICIEVFQSLEKYGYDCIDNDNDDDNVAESIRINEYTFLADGTRHN